MEEKRDIDYFDEKLYFSRSWTDDLMLVAHVDRKADALTISAVDTVVTHANQSLMAVRDVDFLVKTHLFGREVPHSLPPDLPSFEKTILTYSFSVFGRAAAFASYDDTTKLSI